MNHPSDNITQEEWNYFHLLADIIVATQYKVTSKHPILRFGVRWIEDGLVASFHSHPSVDPMKIFEYLPKGVVLHKIIVEDKGCIWKNQNSIGR